MKNKQLHEEILDLLKNRAKMDHEYINPNFLADINGLLYDYYDCEDANVDTWIDDMWGA